MTLDEAIRHAEEVAKEHERHLKIYENIDEDRPLFKEEENECIKCADEHRQLAEWLKDYKQLFEQTQGIKDAIAEIEQIVKEENPEDSSWACGLKYSIGIIRKYTKVGDDNENAN